MRSLRLAVRCAAAILALIVPPTASIANDAVAAQEQAPNGWGFEASDLKPDPAVRFGMLANGMRYAIMANATPKGTASMRFHFNVGSLAEAEDQRGFAHFLEHMAFNGSTRVPEGEMVKLLERLGLAFGPDTNASTGFAETIYMLDLPQVGDSYIDTGLMLMRETASELTIDPKAVDRERGVILGEMRARYNFGLRQFLDAAAFNFPLSPLATRLPIGDETVLKTAPAQRIRDLYEMYYRPDRATLVVVGDIDPAAIETRIKARFSDWAAKRGTPREPVRGTVDAGRPRAIGTFIDPDVPTSVTFTVAKPYRALRDTAETRRRNTIEALANGILNRRLAKLTRQADARFAGASAGGGDVLQIADTATISVTAKDRDWKAALAIGEQELRRALQHGFTDAELAEQIANTRTALRNAADQAGTRTSAALANAIVGTLDDGDVFTTPQSGLARFEAYAPSLTAQDVTGAFRAMWQGASPLIHVSHNAAIDGDTGAIAAQLEASMKVAVMPPAAEAKNAFAHTDFGPAGQVVADSRIADLDIRTVRFANNVQLNIKRTDFEKGRVRVSLRVGGGVLEFGQQPDGLVQLMGAFSAGGTAAHSADEIQSILAGRTVSAGFVPATDAFGGSAATTPDDLLVQLQLFAGLVSQPGFRAEGETQFRNAFSVVVPTLDTTPQGVATRDVGRIIANGDTRTGIPPLDELKKRSFAELRPVISNALARGHIEIGIVGDIDEDDAIAAVARTFGALPARAPDRSGFNAVRTFPKKRTPITLTHGGKPDQGLVQVFWPTRDGFDIAERTRLDLLSAVMQVMLTDELREKMGATYSAAATSVASTVFKGYGYMSVSLTVEPARMADVFGAIDRIAAQLAASPPNADLIARARTPMLERIARGRRENAVWLSIVDEAQTMPGDLESFRRQEAVLSAVSDKQLQQAARRYLTTRSALRISIVPRAKEQTAK
jgi:zinc protease